MEANMSSKARIAEQFWTLLRIQEGEVLREAYFWKRWSPVKLTFLSSGAFLNKKPNKQAGQE